MLRERTADMHRRLEDSLDLASPDVDADRLYDVLSRFHAFWAAAEPELDGWAGREPAVAATLDWPRRRRTARLAADVALLAARTGRGGDTLAAEPALVSPDTAQALGWLYVSEGSTLGGAVITRAVQANPDTADMRLRSFAPYAEGPQPMWRAFQAVLETWTDGDQLRAERVAAAALHTFTALAEWTAVLSGDAAA